MSEERFLKGLICSCMERKTWAGSVLHILLVKDIGLIQIRINQINHTKKGVLS